MPLLVWSRMNPTLLLFPLLALPTCAAPVNPTALRLNDLPAPLLWNIRSSALRLCGGEPVTYTRNTFPAGWRPNYVNAGTPPGGLVIVRAVDLTGDAQPEYVLSHSIEGGEYQARTGYVCDSSLNYRATIPLSQLSETYKEKLKQQKVYAATLHDMLSSDSPRWLELTYPNHFAYRDRVGHGVDYSQYMMPEQALHLLNKHLGIATAPPDANIPSPLFPTRIVHYGDLPPKKEAKYTELPAPKGQPPLPNLQTAPKVLLSYLLSCAASFDFEDVQNEYEQTSETRGGEIRVMMQDLFGGSEPEYLLTYHAPLSYGTEAPAHTPTFVFDHKGIYHYTINNAPYDTVPIFHMLWNSVRNTDHTAGEFTWEKTKFENGVRYIWYQHELREKYARLIIWHSYDCFDKSGNYSTPPRQIELICTANGTFRTDSSCAAGRPGCFRFIEYQRVLEHVCNESMRTPEQPHTDSPFIRTSLHEFLTRPHPRWIVTDEIDKLPEDMRTAAGTFTTQEAINILQKHVQD